MIEIYLVVERGDAFDGGPRTVAAYVDEQDAEMRRLVEIDREVDRVLERRMKTGIRDRGEFAAMATPEYWRELLDDSYRVERLEVIGR